MIKSNLPIIFPLLATLPIFVKSQNSRVVKFVNDCTEDVYFYPTSGAAGDCGSCPGGSTCSSNGYCYYNNPTPANGNYLISANGGTNSVTYPPYSGVDTAWNGNYRFCRSGTTCTASASTCESEGCYSSGPFVQAEMNLIQNAVDWYDVSAIIGADVPVSIVPSVNNGGSSSAPYTCGTPGSPDPNNGLTAASWTFSPPSVEYQWVTPSGSTSCTSNSNCASGEVCGLVQDGAEFSLECGTLSGYWNPYIVCTTNPSTSYFNCDQAVDTGYEESTIAYFVSCAATSGSCYQPTNDECCGCVNWSTNPAGTTACEYVNPYWVSDIEPMLSWLKEGVPTGYVYQYDDVSSTFTCGDLVDGWNTVEYTITLCPSGSTTSTGVNYEGQTCNGAGYTASAAPSYDDCEYLWDEIYGYGDTFTVDADSAFGYTYGTCAIQFCNWGSEAIIYDFNEFASVASGIINFIADDGDDLAQCVFEEGDGAQYIQVQSSTATPDGANYSLSGRVYC